MLRNLTAALRPLATSALKQQTLHAVPAWQRLAAFQGRTLCDMAGPDLCTGRVKWFDAEKGFGFILPDDEDLPDVFVHHTGIVSQGFRKLNPDQLVEFQVITDESGRTKAVEVTGPDGAEIVAEDDNFRNDGYY